MPTKIDEEIVHLRPDSSIFVPKITIILGRQLAQDQKHNTRFSEIMTFDVLRLTPVAGQDDGHLSKRLRLI